MYAVVVNYKNLDEKWIRLAQTKDKARDIMNIVILRIGYDYPSVRHDIKSIEEALNVGLFSTDDVSVCIEELSFDCFSEIGEE